VWVTSYYINKITNQINKRIFRSSGISSSCIYIFPHSAPLNVMICDV
jgi:hypothetical protein